MDLLKDYLRDLLAPHLNTYLVSLIVVAAAIFIWVLIGFIVSTIISKLLKGIMKRRKKALVKREKTILTLFISISRYVFWFYIIMMILTELGINIMPVLASAGIVAFAVGFGAQEMIKDFISGFFLIFENAFDVGDVIEVAEFKGTVLEIGLRRTKIINFKNEVRIVNNGDIRQLTNFSIQGSVGIVDILVPLDYDLNTFDTRAFNSLLLSFKQVPHLLTMPEYIGVISSAAGGTTIRITFNAENNQHFAIERLIRKKILDFVREARINTVAK